jgi:hypothetical protein
MKILNIIFLFVLCFGGDKAFAQTRAGESLTTIEWREDVQFLATELSKRRKNLFHNLKSEDFEKAYR